MTPDRKDAKGEPPRVRGNQSSSGSSLSEYRGGTVYPRVCGGTVESSETLCMAAANEVYPRVCGGTYVSLSRMWMTIMGGTPACAGEPAIPARLQACGRWGNPRVCGGTVVESSHVGARQGLSPRVRGKLIINTGWRNGSGSIPACAGEP